MAEVKQRVRQITEFIDEEISILKSFEIMCGNRRIATVVKEMYRLVMDRPDLQKEILHRHDHKKGIALDRRSTQRKGL